MPEDIFFAIRESISAYFAQAEVQQALTLIKFFSAGISALLMTAIVILLSRSNATWWMAEGLDSFKKVKFPKMLEKSWERINERLQKGDEANLKLAVIEADNLIDDILRRSGYPGKDMGERLQQFEKHELASIDLLWEAHRLRNLIVHQPNMILTKNEVASAISGYEAALKELEVL